MLFLQGGAIGENAIVPMNLVGKKRAADYVITGEWSKKSIKEAGKYCTTNVAASAEDAKFTYIPARDSWKLDPGAAYVHVCTNETIGGVEYQWTPDTGDVPLVSDMSSHILSRVVDVAKFGVIYAGAQKNAGTAGPDARDRPRRPARSRAADHAVGVSLEGAGGRGVDGEYAATWSIYIAGLVFEWLQAQGGLAAIEKRNIEKAALVYDYLDATKFYATAVRREDRSRMNIPFQLHDPALDEAFLKGAKEAGMVQLKGHRAVGGMRASIYNAMPIEGVRALVAYMKDFERRHG